MIRSAAPADAARLWEIYSWYVETSAAGNLNAGTI